jgi:hypothetical protein
MDFSHEEGEILYFLWNDEFSSLNKRTLWLLKQIVS